MPISVVIPTYKNKEQFLKNLRYNMEFLGNCEIIVVNDDPSESLKNELKNYKSVVLIENKKNLGFGQTVNIGVKKARNKYVMLLNNDVVLRDNNYEKALNHFNKDQQLFAICFAQKETNGSIIGKNKIYWQKGFFCHKKADDLNEGYNAWAEGGAAIVDKEKFLKLGGFDPLYSPFYWEDIDLSYRAWKAGYRIIFDPQILVNHCHQSKNSSIRGNFSTHLIRTISFRNQFIFIWKNITNCELITTHLLYLTPTLAISLIKGDCPLVRGFFNASAMMGKILRRRATNKQMVKTDKDILQLFNDLN